MLLGAAQVFLRNVQKSTVNTAIYISETSFYYLCLHFKLAATNYATQLVDMFAYELPLNINNLLNKARIALSTSTIIVYNFHSIFFQQRFYLFISNFFKQNIAKIGIAWTSLQSITELFLNANWLEREIAELHGVFFSGKKDLRNLMLQYGDTSAPFRKSFPSVGIKEVFYDTITDLLIQNTTSIQA